MSAPTSTTVDYLCWNDNCLGVGRWLVMVDAETLEPLDENDAYCPTCDELGDEDA